MPVRRPGFPGTPVKLRGQAAIAADPVCLRKIESAGGALLAISGGADSSALFHALTTWSTATSANLRLEVIHVDHQLRGEESRLDAEFVGDLCRRTGITYHLRRVSDPAERPAGETLEEFLRRERYRSYREVLEETGLRVLATGHTADDLAESFLMHLMRGAGLRGLSFSPVAVLDGGELVRPLWQVSRAKLEDYLQAHGQPFRVDASNLSMEFTRNRVRHLLIPFMEHHFNPAIRDTLIKTALRLSSAESFLRSVVKNELDRLLEPATGGLSLNADNLLQLNPFLQGEVVGEWIRKGTGRVSRPGSAQIEQVLHVARNGRGTVSLPGRHGVEATGGLLNLIVAGAAGDLEAFPASWGTNLPLGLILAQEISFSPDLERQWWTAAALAHLNGKSAVRVELRYALEDAESPPSLVLRNRQPGDRFSESRKLKSVLINDKIPPAVRDRLLLIAGQDGQVYHVVGMDRINARLRASLPLSRRLQVQWFSANENES